MHCWALENWAIATEELNLSFYLLLLNWNLNNYMWPMAILLGSKDLDHLCTTWTNILMPDDCNRWNDQRITTSPPCLWWLPRIPFCFWIQNSCSSPWRELREVNYLYKSSYGKGLICSVCAMVGEGKHPLFKHSYPALVPPPWELCETGPGMSLQLLMVQITLTLLAEMNKEK